MTETVFLGIYTKILIAIVNHRLKLFAQLYVFDNINNT